MKPASDSSRLLLYKLLPVQAVTFLVIHQKHKKSLEEITNDLCPVLSVQQLYRISTMYWDDRFGTETVSQDVLARMKQRGWSTDHVHVYGDATGNARDSTSGTSDWIIVRNRLASLGPVMRVPRSNPAVKETINAVSAKLMTADGGVSLAVHPRCHGLIADLRDALWPSPTLLHDAHALAWLRYFVHREYPVKLDVTKREPGSVGFAG